MTFGSPQAPGPPRAIQTRVADQLLAEGAISRDAWESAIAQFRRSGGRIEEALLEVKAIDELPLLKFLASTHRTQFITTDKLAHAKIDPATLGRVPRKLAEKFHVVPVLYDAQKNLLALVTCDPDNVDLFDQVRAASGVKDVRACIARPAAAKAAMRK